MIWGLLREGRPVATSRPRCRPAAEVLEVRLAPAASAVPQRAQPAEVHVVAEQDGTQPELDAVIVAMAQALQSPRDKATAATAPPPVVRPAPPQPLPPPVAAVTYVPRSYLFGVGGLIEATEPHVVLSPVQPSAEGERLRDAEAIETPPIEVPAEPMTRDRPGLPDAEPPCFETRQAAARVVILAAAPEPETSELGPLPAARPCRPLFAYAVLPALLWLLSCGSLIRPGGWSGRPAIVGQICNLPGLPRGDWSSRDQHGMFPSCPPAKPRTAARRRARRKLTSSASGSARR